MNDPRLIYDATINRNRFNITQISTVADATRIVNSGLPWVETPRLHSNHRYAVKTVHPPLRDKNITLIRTNIVRRIRYHAIPIIRQIPLRKSVSNDVGVDFLCIR